MNKLAEPKTIWNNLRSDITYPPSEKNVGRTMPDSIRQALELFESNNPQKIQPWEMKFDKKDLEVRSDELNTLAQSYIDSLKPFKNNRISYATTFEAVRSALDNIRSLDIVYGKNLQSIFSNHSRVAVTTALLSFEEESIWHDYYFNPEKINELDENYKQVIDASLNHLSWATIQHLDPELKNRENPFTPLLKLHLNGCYSTGFFEDANGHEFYTVKFKGNEKDKFHEFVYPVE